MKFLIVLLSLVWLSHSAVAQQQPVRTAVVLNAQSVDKPRIYSNKSIYAADWNGKQVVTIATRSWGWVRVEVAAPISAVTRRKAKLGRVDMRFSDRTGFSLQEKLINNRWALMLTYNR